MQTELILPWQKQTWEALLQRKNEGRLPHALLFSGIDGVGKKELANAFADYLLCLAPSQNGACGNCRSCHLQQAKSHPDFMQVRPEESGQFIKIDQVREVVDFVNSTAMLGGYRVIVISPASAMNVYAANALLKTLEEPTPNTLLILICNQSLRLPATISSRCQKINFTRPERSIALTWLRTKVSSEHVGELPLALDLAEGAPLQARDLLIDGTLAVRRDLYDGLSQLGSQQVDPLQFAARWEDKEVKAILTLLLVWLRDLLRCKLAGNQAELVNSDYRAALNKLTAKFSQENLLKYGDLLQTAYAQILNSLNVNRQLLLKEIFIRWVQSC